MRIRLFNALPVMILLLVAGCSTQEEPAKQVLRPVVYQEVGYAGTVSKRMLSGVAQTEKVINLSFRNSGIITLFNITLGQKVSKGELLAKLDNVQARLSLQQAEASLSSAESQMNTAKLTYDRVRTLYEKGSASLSDFESAKNSYQTAQNSFEGAQRSLDIQKEQVNYGFIYAPESGILAAVNAEIDENVSPGQVVAVLNAGEDMVINIGIPESVINLINKGLRAQVSFPALPGNRYQGVVTEVAPSADRQSATYPVKVELTDNGAEVKSGMAANVTFSFEESSGDQLMVPASAVGEDSDGRFVFLINEGTPATVKKQRIKVGELSGVEFEVLEGLTAGQKIAIAGLQTLLDGQQVKLNK